MTEEESKAYLMANFGVSGETWERLEAFVAFLRIEAQVQNLVAASTLATIWNRHIVDSAQLLTLLPDGRPQTNWVDLGSGAGFPGMVVAILSSYDVTLVESRKRRIDYLQRAISLLDIGNRVTLAGMPLERLPTVPYSVISARAFAPLPRLFELASRFSTDKTVWLLPKGRNAANEWDDAKIVWEGDFRIEPSVTEPQAGIIVGQLTGARQEAR